jgi:KDO2-lipid IV(A) lauroyltransferase
MVVAGHFGNWEMASYILGMMGFTGYVIARPLDNVYLHRWMHRWRESTGQKLVAKNGEFELIESALRNGKILCTIGDQDAGQRGLFVNFFNRPASTHKAIALLALGYKPMVLVGGCARVGDGFRYRAHFEDVIDPLEYADDPDAVRAITVRFTEALERLIRRYPEQYFWIHRRWKHQPLPSKKRKAA